MEKKFGLKQRDTKLSFVFLIIALTAAQTTTLTVNKCKWLNTNWRRMSTTAIWQYSQMAFLRSHKTILIPRVRCHCIVCLEIDQPHIFTSLFNHIFYSWRPQIRISVHFECRVQRTRTWKKTKHIWIRSRPESSHDGGGGGGDRSNAGMRLSISCKQTNETNT